MEQHKTKHILDNVKYAVFALGSRAYPHFCEFGHNVDYSLGNLGADQIISCGEGDELSRQDESFHEWSQNCFVVIYFYIIQPFSAWCPLKGHTYLNKPAADSCRFV